LRGWYALIRPGSCSSGIENRRLAQASGINPMQRFATEIAENGSGRIFRKCPFPPPHFFQISSKDSSAAPVAHAQGPTLPPLNSSPKISFAIISSTSKQASYWLRS
jgi:hypothetical protein